jgi:6-phosphofructo-2-kinase
VSVEPKVLPAINWLKLAPEDGGEKGIRIRHSVGLDVPGAVHTITTPSKYNMGRYYVTCPYIFSSLELKMERQLDSKLVVIMGKLSVLSCVYVSDFN